MRIGIDCRMWQQTGIGRYIRNIVKQLAELDPHNEYILFVLPNDYDTINLPHNFKKIIVDVRWHTFKEQLVIPYVAYKNKLDVLFCPNINVPVLYFKKFITTIHDLTVLRVKTGRVTTLPYVFYLVKRIGVSIALYKAAYFSKAIFCVTNHIKDDVKKTFKLSDKKFYLTPCAVSDKFYKRPQDQINKAIEKYKIMQPYIFYVGNAHPHKNLERLIKSFNLLSANNPDITLVLGGKTDFFYKRLQKEYKEYATTRNIHFTGFIDDEDLPAIYSGAQMLVNPSMYEGFGIQLLEAFACGTKVACSKSTSLPEVGADIAYYFNPKDIQNMCEVMQKCLNDADEKRIQAGYNRIKDYSWKSSAKVIFDYINGLN